LHFDVILAGGPLQVSRLNAKSMRSFLGERLPRQAVPGQFVCLDEMPLGPNGKVARKALRPPRPESRTQPGDVDAPRNETERRLADIWQQTLSIERIGIRQDFFAIGGDSLLAARLAIAVRRSFDIELPVSAIFEAATIEELAAVVAMLRPTTGKDPGAASQESQLETGEL
jgi:acyl carrier protein